MLYYKGLLCFLIGLVIETTLTEKPGCLYRISLWHWWHFNFIHIFSLSNICWSGLSTSDCSQAINLYFCGTCYWTHLAHLCALFIYNSFGICTNIGLGRNPNIISSCHIIWWCFFLSVSAVMTIPPHLLAPCFKLGVRNLILYLKVPAQVILGHFLCIIFINRWI